MNISNFILFFNQIGIVDIAKVGGKNASLGEMYNQLNTKGIGIPNGFALTADAYRLFRKQNNIEKELNDLLLSLDTEHYSNLISIGETARALILSGTFPKEIVYAVDEAYQNLSAACGIENLDVAVRSSATAEDLPTASFAGRIE
jgi:pyruvate,water dikinase